MENSFFGPYSPYDYPQYPPWTYQRSYPFPGFRQTGACPQHGAFYGHGACFQPPQNLPAAESSGDYGLLPTQSNAATTTSSPSAKQVLVSPNINAISRPSPTNLLSPRAETFVPISGQHTISSIGDSETANLMNRDTGQRFIVHQDTQPDHNPPMFPHAPGQAEISQDATPLQPDLSRAVNYTSSANLKAGRNPAIPSNQFVRNTSPVAHFDFIDFILFILFMRICFSMPI